MDIIVNLIGLALIVFIIWWFWLAKRQTSTEASKLPIDIKVEGGIYIPDTIKAKVGQPIQLRFTREDPSPCAEAVVFNDLELSQTLALNQPTIIQITVDKPGHYAFACPMGMYRGKLIIS